MARPLLQALSMIWKSVQSGVHFLFTPTNYTQAAAPQVHLQFSLEEPCGPWLAGCRNPKHLAAGGHAGRAAGDDSGATAPRGERPKAWGPDSGGEISSTEGIFGAAGSSTRKVYAVDDTGYGSKKRGPLHLTTTSARGVQLKAETI